MKSADRTTSHLLSPREGPARLSLVIPMHNEEAMLGLLREATVSPAPCLKRTRVTSS